jgi:putative alpha-1,2-mannosidase
VFSLWDTYRATHPLFALIQSRRDADMINSLLVHYDQSVDHLLPMWELQGNETWCMIGHRRIAVLQIDLRDLQVHGGLVGGLVLDVKQAHGVGLVAGAERSLFAGAGIFRNRRCRRVGTG